jgi:hypothetical protein
VNKTPDLVANSKMNMLEQLGHVILNGSKKSGKEKL